MGFCITVRVDGISWYRNRRLGMTPALTYFLIELGCAEQHYATHRALGSARRVRHHARPDRTEGHHHIPANGYLKLHAKRVPVVFCICAPVLCLPAPAFPPSPSRVLPRRPKLVMLIGILYSCYKMDIMSTALSSYLLTTWFGISGTL